MFRFPRQGELEAAESLLRQALEITTAIHGENHRDVADTLTLLASCLVAQERFDEAYEQAGVAKRIYASSLPDGHWLTAVAASNEGAALTGLRRFAEAEELLVESYAVLSNDTSAIPAFVDEAGARLVSLYEVWGKPEKAAKILAMTRE